MKKVVNLNAVGDYNAMVGHETFHPLVSVIDFSKTDALLRGGQPWNYGFYCVYLKAETECVLRYGRSNYDYQAGTLVFIAPGQVLSIIEEDMDYQPSGYALLFHPDLLRGTALGQHMKDYSFFSYDVHEALHLSEQEKPIVLESLQKIDYEVRHAVDKHSKKLIVSNIELFLNYCVRFYDRQFITRDHVSNGVVENFERLLNDYFTSNKLESDGIPSVAHFADELHLSANYFGDLIKKETGKTALENIQAKLIDLAKEKIFDRNKRISDVSYELGFKYPQHFIRFFKQRVGRTPNEYRISLN
ncbi:helix-turn-helix domain-containing protein [Puia dinghuensis]|uniref:AraC family transcriptional regulator n=1 Tax=Puia dinghuensis TaxID=1792502 RepID=A0A8J2U7T9_9BACT|nr:AraC family transcriptional regulator [Puia dinghuensis]GGA85012.1 AraC family transcriptional regulator [Puia dinghuensis]